MLSGRFGVKRILFLCMLAAILICTNILPAAANNSEITIYNTDSDENAISGACYTLISKDGTAKAIVVGDDGIAAMELTTGTYTLLETKAAKGFFSNKKSIKFSVNDKNEIALEGQENVNISVLNNGRTLHVISEKEPPSAYLQEQQGATEQDVIGGTLLSNNMVLIACAILICSVVIIIGVKKKR